MWFWPRSNTCRLVSVPVVREQGRGGARREERRERERTERERKERERKRREREGGRGREREGRGKKGQPKEAGQGDDQSIRCSLTVHEKKLLISRSLHSSSHV